MSPIGGAQNELFKKTIFRGFKFAAFSYIYIYLLETALFIFIDYIKVSEQNVLMELSFGI